MLIMLTSLLMRCLCVYAKKLQRNVREIKIMTKIDSKRKVMFPIAITIMKNDMTEVQKPWKRA